MSDPLTELAPAFRSAAAEYAARRAEAEAAAVEWRWASDTHFSLQLFRFERGRHRAGRWLAREPRGNIARCQYGLDAAGRIVVGRQAIWGSDEHKTETFVRYGDDFAEAVQFGSAQDKPLELLERQAIESNVVQRCQWYGGHQRGLDVYAYRQGRLCEIDSLWSNHPHREEDLLSAVYRVAYDEDGAVSRIEVEYRRVGRHRGGTFTCYRRPKRPPGAGS